MNRQAFLDRVREALASTGGILESGAPPEPLGPVGQPKAAERAHRVAQFVRELESAGGHLHHARSEPEAAERIRDLVSQRGAHRVVRTRTTHLSGTLLDGALGGAGASVAVGEASDERERAGLREAELEADMGITSADFGVAETGTLALLTGPGQGGSVSLLPPIHVAVLRAKDIVADVGELFERIATTGALASAVILVTGPSRTADIELVLTVGVHGPKELHVVLLESDGAD